MNITEIISDALVYPFNNIKALILYIVLGIVAGIAFGGTALGMVAGAAANNSLLAGGAGIIGFIIFFIILLLIMGYQLDIVKYGIRRDSGAPGIEIGRQVVNAIKLLIVNIVYYIIPIIILAILAIIFRHWIVSILALILGIIFALAEFMGECRLAKTDSLGEGLAIGAAIGDISRVGLLKILGTVVISAIIIFIVVLIIIAIASVSSTVSAILMGIFGVYLVFFVSRVKGLLYSDV